MLVIVSDRTLEPVLFKDRERQKDKATYIEIYVECRAHPPYTHTHTHLPSSNATQFKNLPLILHSQWPRSSSNRQRRQVSFIAVSSVTVIVAVSVSLSFIFYLHASCPHLWQ